MQYRSKRKPLVEDPPTMNDSADEDNAKIQKSRHFFDRLSPNQILLSLACIFSLITLYRFMLSSSKSLTRTVVCHSSNLADCDLSGERIIYDPGQEITILKKIQSQDEFKVERPDKKITHTTTKEELSRIQKRSSNRQEYILNKRDEVARKKPLPIIKKQSAESPLDSPRKTRTQSIETKTSKDGKTKSSRTKTISEEELEILRRVVPPTDYIEGTEDLSIDEMSTRLIAEANRLEKDLEDEANQIEKEASNLEDEAEGSSELATYTEYDSEILLSLNSEIEEKVNELLKDKMHFFAYGRVGIYQHESSSVAQEACKDAGYTGLCDKQDVILAAKQDDIRNVTRQPACYSGWTSGGEAGWYQVKKDPTCGGPNRWMVWKPKMPDAHCCGIPGLAERLKTWFQAGCTREGLLFPDANNQGLSQFRRSYKLGATWMSMTDPDRAIAELAARAQQGDRISIASCYGMNKVKQVEPQEKAKGITFHMLWECYGDNADDCRVPDGHRLCLLTLRNLHPEAEVIMWSKSLDEDMFALHFEGLNFELRRYDLSLFEGLPGRAKDAAHGITSYFTKHENSFSHWSDLFRSSVLYKFGGIYADLDNIWFRPIERVLSSEQWIPMTEIWDNPDFERLINRQGTKYYLEGGIMRAQKNSPFLLEVLENFPIYNQSMAECWNCVGPRHLTETWVRLNEDANFSVEEMPEVIESQLIYGVRDYRNEFKTLMAEFDKRIWFGLDGFGCAGAHLFSSSAKEKLHNTGLIAKLFEIAGVHMNADIDLNWRPSAKEQSE